MSLDSIQALLEALKRTESQGGLPGDDTPGQPIAAKLSVLKAVPKGDVPDTSGMSDDALAPLPSDLNAASPDDGGPTPDAGADADKDNPKEVQRNAEIVDALQDQYPTIYDKIMKQLSAGADQSADDDDTGVQAAA
jgi:hypothetical protein